MSLEAAWVPPFPHHALPGPLGWYAGEISRATQTPLILAAGVTLGAASIALARKIVVEPRPGWVEQLVLWILVLLASGERKTAAMNALRRPLDEWERDRRKELTPQIAQAESQREILTRRLREAEKGAAGGDENATEAALELARQLSELEVPSLPKLTTSDTTQEAAAILCAQNEGKIAVWSDEGEIVKVIAGRYSKDQSPAVELFLKGYSGGYYSSSRVGRDGVSLQDPAIPKVLSIQPGVVFGLGNRRVLHEQGYFARPLYGLPSSALGSRKSRPEPADERAREAYGEMMKTLLDIEMPKDEYGEASPHTLRFSQAADELLEDLQDWVEPQLGPSGEMRSFREWGSKFAGQVVRIAGILHLTDRVTAGEERPWETPVERATLRRAIEIGLCYLEHGRAVMVEMGADPRIGGARHLLEVFEGSNIARISTRDLFDKVRKDSRFKTMDDLAPVIELLKEHGYVRELKPKKPRGPGRPRSRVLEVNPLPPKTPPQNPQNPQNPTPGGTKPFFEWLEERRGPEDPPPSPGPGGPEPEGPSPSPEAAPPTDEAGAHDYLRGRDASGVLLEEPNQNGHYPSPEAEPEHEVEKGYELVIKQAQLGEIISEVEATQMMGLDLETTGLCWWRDRIRVVSISTEAGKTYLVDAFEVDIEPLFPALKDTKIVAHNALFDALFLRRVGFEAGEYACTMVLSQILWAGKLKPRSEKNVDHDLASVAKRALGEHLDKREQKVDWSGELTPEMLDYAARDSRVLLPLYRKLMRLIKEAG